LSQTPKWLESLILIFILLAGAILGFTFLVEQPPHTPLYPDVPSAESGWLTGFLYRKSGWFKDTTGALSFFPVTFVVHYGDGTDGTDVVYLDSKCQSDFDDIRFTDSTGSAEFDYWLDPDFTYDGDNVTVWVESVNSMAGISIMGTIRHPQLAAHLMFSLSMMILTGLITPLWEMDGLKMRGQQAAHSQSAATH